MYSTVNSKQVITYKHRYHNVQSIPTGGGHTIIDSMSTQNIASAIIQNYMSQLAAHIILYHHRHRAQNKLQFRQNLFPTAIIPMQCGSGRSLFMCEIARRIDKLRRSIRHKPCLVLCIYALRPVSIKTSSIHPSSQHSTLTISSDGAEKSHAATQRFKWQRWSGLCPTCTFASTLRNRNA